MVNKRNLGNTENFYNQIHKNVVNSVISGNDPPTLQELKLLLKKNKNKKSKILEIGCGYGQTLFHLKKFGFKNIYAIDSNIDAYKFIKKNMTSIKIYHDYAQNLPFKSNFFDIIICHGVLHHTNSLNKGIKEISRVSKKNAKVYLGLYLFKNSLFEIIIKLARKIFMIVPMPVMRKLLFFLPDIYTNFILDHLYVPILNCYKDKQIKKLLKKDFIMSFNKVSNFDFFLNPNYLILS